MARLTPQYLKKNKRHFDLEDAEVIARLESERKCTERLVVDGGRHYIYCGAYHDRPAYHVSEKRGMRCPLHGGDASGDFMGALGDLS
jgi:hypothetical protein